MAAAPPDVHPSEGKSIMKLLLSGIVPTCFQMEAPAEIKTQKINEA